MGVQLEACYALTLRSTGFICVCPPSCPHRLQHLEAKQQETNVTLRKTEALLSGPGAGELKHLMNQLLCVLLSCSLA